jgi:phospholipid/cholesterol/gamma-HCH transport system substrate-binding protein
MKNDTIRQFWAGVFFVAGVCLVSWVIWFIGFQKGLTEPQFSVVVLFEKVGGLSNGAPVRLSGVNVGSVQDIDFLDQEVMGRGIKVTLSVQKKFEPQVRRGTSISVQTEGVLGAKYIEIRRKNGQDVVDMGRPVMGEPMLDVYDLAEVLEGTAASFNETTQSISAVMLDLRSISRKTKRVLDRIEERAIDGKLFKVF